MILLKQLGNGSKISFIEDNMSPKITLIVPVYNVADYLPQCLDSLVGQTFKDIEILCINDGSTDNSPAILADYAKKDSRIRIITQKNAGQGAARNVGIREAKGKYLGFIDSDDWADIHFCEKMYQMAEKNQVDLVIARYVNFDDKLQKPVSYPDIEDLLLFENFQGRVFAFDDIKELYFNQICGAPWNKLYKTEFMRKNELYFPEGIKYEDYPHFFKTFICVNRAVLCPDKLYFYRQNRRGSDSTNIKRNGFTFFSHFNDIEETLKKHNRYEELKPHFFKIKIMGLLYWMHKSAKKYRVEFYRLIQEEFRRMNLTKEELACLPSHVRTAYLHTKKYNYYYYTYVRRTALKIFSVSYDPETHIFRFRLLFFFKIKKRLSK